MRLRGKTSRLETKNKWPSIIAFCGSSERTWPFAYLYDNLLLLVTPYETCIRVAVLTRLIFTVYDQLEMKSGSTANKQLFLCYISWPTSGNGSVVVHSSTPVVSEQERALLAPPGQLRAAALQRGNKPWAQLELECGTHKFAKETVASCITGLSIITALFVHREG